MLFYNEKILVLEKHNRSFVIDYLVLYLLNQQPYAHVIKRFAIEIQDKVIPMPMTAAERAAIKGFSEGKKNEQHSATSKASDDLEEERT